jgi:hypothetical protein
MGKFSSKHHQKKADAAPATAQCDKYWQTRPILQQKNSSTITRQKTKTADIAQGYIRRYRLVSPAGIEPATTP